MSNSKKFVQFDRIHQCDQCGVYFWHDPQRHNLSPRCVSEHSLSVVCKQIVRGSLIHQIICFSIQMNTNVETKKRRLLNVWFTDIVCDDLCFSVVSWKLTQTALLHCPCSVSVVKDELVSMKAQKHIYYTYKTLVLLNSYFVNSISSKVDLELRLSTI